MINWNEVAVGKTEIISPANETWLIVGRNNGKVWLYSDGVHYTRKEDSLGDWTIYDPWEDVSEECEWVPDLDTFGGWSIYHNKQAILHSDSRYKSDGRRVWKRKEGRDE